MADSSEERFSNSNFAEIFGQCHSVHRVNRGCFELVAVPSLLFALALFGYAAYLGSGDWVTLPVCVGPFVLLFFGVVWHLITTRSDELKIFANGFTYRHGRRVATCLWNEIEAIEAREPTADEIGVPGEDLRLPLIAVRKKNGERIEFDRDIEGTLTIRDRFE